MQPSLTRDTSLLGTPVISLRTARVGCLHGLSGLSASPTHANLARSARDKPRMAAEEAANSFASEDALSPDIDIASSATPQTLGRTNSPTKLIEVWHSTSTNSIICFLLYRLVCCSRKDSTLAFELNAALLSTKSMLSLSYADRLTSLAPPTNAAAGA